MRLFALFRAIMLIAASLGYFSNGAQAHVEVHPGESLQVLMCGSKTLKPVALKIPGQPIEETEGTSCGDCAAQVAVQLTQPHLSLITLQHSRLEFPHLVHRVSPRSPLWPGAPPNGPPELHKA